MTREELEKIKDKNVGKKVLEILRNGFLALFKKEFGEDNEFITFLNSMDYSGLIDENEFGALYFSTHSFIPPNNIGKAMVKLTKWATGELRLGYDFKENIEILKKVQSFEKYTGIGRIIEFEYLCKDNNYSYEIWYDECCLVSEITKKINDIGKGVLKLHKIDADSRKLDIILNFDKKYFIFRVFFRDSEDFLECLKQLIENCKNKNLNTYTKIRKEIEGLPLQEYRVTK